MLRSMIYLLVQNLRERFPSSLNLADPPKVGFKAWRSSNAIARRNLTYHWSQFVEKTSQSPQRQCYANQGCIVRDIHLTIG